MLIWPYVFLNMHAFIKIEDNDIIITFFNEFKLNPLSAQRFYG